MLIDTELKHAPMKRYLLTQWLFMIFVIDELYQKFFHPCAPQLKRVFKIITDISFAALRTERTLIWNESCSLNSYPMHKFPKSLPDFAWNFSGQYCKIYLKGLRYEVIVKVARKCKSKGCTAETRLRI